ncbi:MAG: metallophosphoesterase family protein [Pseudomonadota bacterium]
MKLFRRTSSGAKTPEGVRLYAIGDIHGCIDELNLLLRKIDSDARDAPQRRLIFLGDYVDRGPDSRGVIDRLIEISKTDPDAVFLKGNHEAAMLRFLDDPDTVDTWLEWGGEETMRSYGVICGLKSGSELAATLREKMPEDHETFLRSLALTHREGDYFFVHAGVRPGVTLEDQKEEDLLWIRGRFHDTQPDERPDLTVVHGHQADRRPINKSWRICVDTMAYHTGVLTAVVLDADKRRFIST